MFTSYLQYFFVNFEKDFAHKVTKTHANLSYTEAVARKISQNSQENTCVRVYGTGIFL